MSSDGITLCGNDSDAWSESPYRFPSRRRCTRYVCACSYIATSSRSHLPLEPLPRLLTLEGTACHPDQLLDVLLTIGERTQHQATRDAEYVRCHLPQLDVGAL